MKRWAWALSLSVLAVFAASGRADILVLGDGSVEQGRIVGPVNDQGFWFEKYGDGGRVHFFWMQLQPTNAERHRRRFGLTAEEREAVLVDAWRIVLTNGATYDGLIQETDNQVIVSNAEGATGLFKSQIESREAIKVPALQVYAPEKAYELERAQFSEPLSAKDQLALGDMARGIGLLDKAEEHYLNAKDLDPTLEARVDALMVVLAEERARQALEQQLQQFKTLARQNRYGSAIAGLQQIMKDHRKDPIAETAQKLIDDIEAQARAAIARDFWGTVESMAAKKVKEKDLTLGGARSYAQGQLLTDAVAALGERYELQSKDVTRYFKERGSEFRKRTLRYQDAAFFEGGATGQSAEASSAAGAAGASGAAAQKAQQGGLNIPGLGGSGDLQSLLEGFIGNRGGSQGGGNRGRQNATPAQQQQAAAQPRKKTPDEWWTGAATSKRKNYILCRFVEHGARGSLDVEVEPTKSDKILRFQ